VTSPVAFPGGADPGGRDDVADTVAGAVAAAQARYREHQSDTYGQGSRIGDDASYPAPEAYAANMHEAPPGERPLSNG
jgi:hypothetical protein